MQLLNLKPLDFQMDNFNKSVDKNAKMNFKKHIQVPKIDNNF
jgi:hypothetical protein